MIDRWRKAIRQDEGIRNDSEKVSDAGFKPLLVAIIIPHESILILERYDPVQSESSPHHDVKRHEPLTTHLFEFDFRSKVVIITHVDPGLGNVVKHRVVIIVGMHVTVTQLDRRTRIDAIADRCLKGPCQL